MREVAIVSYAQTPYVRSEQSRSEVEMILSVVREAVEGSGIPKADIGFTCSGSSDYLAGQAFAFVGAVDALGAWPPIAESHVEMDGAWAMYEAWVKIQCGQADSALAFSFGRSSMGDTRNVLALQLDPYTLAPLGPDTVAMAALQARAGLDSGAFRERDMAEVAVRARRNAKDNPFAQLRGDFEADKLLAEPYIASPLRKHDCPPISDGAAAIVIAAGDLAREVCERPVWIRGIDHRLDTHQPGGRDLTKSPSAQLAARKACEQAGSDALDIAELHAPFSHQELILKQAMGLPDSTRINPSGGPLAANPIMVAGLARIGEASKRVASGEAQRALAHATQGHCLQQNLACVLEGN